MKWTQRLEALALRVDKALTDLEQAQPVMPPELTALYPWAADAVSYLERRRDAGAHGDCPLPELFNAVAARHKALSIAAFHEGLKKLRERRLVKLTVGGRTPTVLSRPEFALLLDGEMLYYAAR